MGYLRFKRPPLFSGGLSVASGQTITSGGLTVSKGGIVLSSGEFSLPVENITLTAADKTISRYGVSFVTYGTSGAGRDAVLQAPSRVGQLKYIFVINNTTSVDCSIHTNATANVFWGTTFNTAQTAAASTGSPGGTPAGTAALHLVAASTTQWAIIPGSSFNWDLVASTGSTSIP